MSDFSTYTEPVLDNESETNGSNHLTNGSPKISNNVSLKPTLSEAMMKSNLYQSLPKYIFQTEHAPLKMVNNILHNVQEQQTKESMISDPCEVSEYPIEIYEHQQHAIERHMSIK